MFLTAFNTNFNTMIVGKLFQKGFGYSGIPPAGGVGLEFPASKGALSGAACKKKFDAIFLLKSCAAIRVDEATAGTILPSRLRFFRVR
jgi:hypothetical protein